jgi:hypothetical protein
VKATHDRVVVVAVGGIVEGVALDFGSLDLDFGADVGHVSPKVSFGAKFLRYCISIFLRTFFCKLGQFHSETSFRDVFIPCFLQLPS